MDFGAIESHLEVFHWLLATGYWLLATGSWLLATRLLRLFRTGYFSNSNLIAPKSILKALPCLKRSIPKFPTQHFAPSSFIST